MFEYFLFAELNVTDTPQKMANTFHLIQKQHPTGILINLKPYINIPRIFVPYVMDLKSIFRINDALAKISEGRIKEALMRRGPYSSIIGIHIRANEEYKTHLKSFKATITGSKYYQK